MAVGIEPKEIVKGLDGDDGTGEGIPLRHRILRKSFRESQAQRAHVGKKIPVIEKIPPRDLRDTEDDMSVGNILEYVGAEPFPEFHHPLLMAGKVSTARPGFSRRGACRQSPTS